MLHANTYKEPDDYITINPDFRVIEVNRKKVVLHGEHNTVTLCGELRVELVSLMDGTLRLGEIKALLSTTFDQASVEEAICELVDSGYATYGPSSQFAFDTAQRMLNAIIANRERWSGSPRIRYTADGVLKPDSGRYRRRRASK